MSILTFSLPSYLRTHQDLRTLPTGGECWPVCFSTVALHCLVLGSWSRAPGVVLPCCGNYGGSRVIFWQCFFLGMLLHLHWSLAVSENKALCHPSSVDSLSTSAATEDHVSMGGWAARKALRVIEHVEQGKACTGRQASLVNRFSGSFSEWNHCPQKQYSSETHWKCRSSGHSQKHQGEEGNVTKELSRWLCPSLKTKN